MELSDVLFFVGGFFVGFGFFRFMVAPRALCILVLGLAGQKIVMRVDDKDYKIDIQEVE